MDTDIARDALGDSGVVGVSLAFLGVLAVARENRRIGLGTALVLAGCGLLGYGLVGSFLGSMGMEYEDLY